jgi:hypothetical protein
VLVAAILSAWLQYAADGEPHARAVVSGAACPNIVAAGKTIPMSERAGKAARFDDVVCDAVVPYTARQARVGDRDLPRPARNPGTVVVIGDTGCRLSPTSSQSCNDPNAWPFPLIARSIAAVHPDLVVHVGDYLYRESPCPLLARCAGSPHGDDAPAWYADFLAPAAPIFASAPLVLLRGNHEECGRNGPGWFRYLDPHATTQCTNRTEPYALGFGDLRIVAFDSAISEDHTINPASAATLRRQFAAVRTMAEHPDPRPSGMRSLQLPLQQWFVTHRPPYLNEDERSAMGEALAPFDAVLSGHIHFFSALNVASMPPLIVNGEGGTKLDPNYAPLFRLATGDLRIEGEPFGWSHFGFAVYRRNHDGWSISLREPDGTPRAHCTIANRTVTCLPGA